MDFGKILDEWESVQGHSDKTRKTDQRDNSSRSGDRAERAEKSSVNGNKNRDISRSDDWTAHLDKYAPSDDVIKQKEEDEHSRLGHKANVGKKAAKDLLPQRVLDLHGMVSDTAHKTTMNFLKQASRDGLKKVLIIHGKGNHSQEEPVLKRVVKTCIDVSPHAGLSGTPGRALGGSGATWVLIKK
ncbi:MAG: Smr/MutS family protein [Spirochaetia bacterium]|nr:Smr/MutS family protein [Spirochaetia bacterium]MCF7952561.1 Smr/MutS family protein [Spirochaetales bacterium]